MSVIGLPNASGAFVERAENWCPLNQGPNTSFEMLILKSGTLLVIVFSLAFGILNKRKRFCFLLVLVIPMQICHQVNIVVV